LVHHWLTRASIGRLVACFSMGLAIVAVTDSCGGGAGGGGNATPTPPPVVACTAGSGVQNATCSAQSAQFASQVDAAIEKTITDHPDFFDFNQVVDKDVPNSR